MNATEKAALRTKYLETRKASGMDTAKFDRECRATMYGEGMRREPTPAEWVEAAESVAHWHLTSKSVQALADGKCPRCGGVGVIQAFQSVNGGECFECGGTGKAD